MTPKQSTILENGEGLFNTHVHLEDVQEVIAEQMNTGARLGSNSKYTVIGDGNGFMSRVILVEPEWTVSDDHLPDKFILKITSCLHVHALVDKMKASSPGNITEEQEAQLWAILRTRPNLCTTANPKIYFSKQFSADNKTKGFLGMEFVDNVTIRHLYANAKPHELHPVLKSLATLQVEGLHLSDEERQSISGFDFKQLVGQMMDEDGMKRNFEQTRNISRDRLTEKADKLEALGTELVNFELACNLNKYVGIERDVLVHGDLWAANILWKEENEGHFSVSRVIDYQLIHMGNPAEDLVRLFLSCLSGSDRQVYWEKLVEQFYDYFVDALADQKAPYTLEQLKESYRHYFVTGGLVMLPMYGPIAEAKLAYSNSEDVEEYKEILTEKAEHLLEDLERWHLYSRNTTKNYDQKMAEAE
ncbi:unnamed protein product [Caenorhabditis sp. 36 PRJEB53466]|nr:unnamed protein product [Caenorhabditis sp. 36 PRJEB53466]